MRLAPLLRHLSPQHAEEHLKLRRQLGAYLADVVMCIEHEGAVDVTAVVVGELCEKLIFQVMQHLVLDDREIPVEFGLFDNLGHGGREVTEKKLTTRRALLFVESDERTDRGAIHILGTIQIDE